MKIIDIEKSPRKKHFEFYNRLDYPHFNITVPVDVTKFYLDTKEMGVPFFRAFLHQITRTANGIKEFRQRIRDDNVVVEHEIVHPSFTVMLEDDAFSFCSVDYKSDLQEFLTEIDEKIESLKGNICIEDEPGRDDQLYISCIPWVSFTSLVHPIHMNPVDSVPRICWGKFTTEGDKKMMPVSIQAHHALMDGFHVGLFFKKLLLNK